MLACGGRLFNIVDIVCKFNIAIFLVVVFLAAACRQEKGTVAESKVEDKAAKAMLQGIWIDADSENIVFKVEGDTIYYPDNGAQPARFAIFGDTLVIGDSGAGYPISKQTDNLFWFTNAAGELVRLVKSSDPTARLAFGSEKPKVLALTEVLKKDTVVMYVGERYHCYIAINPTKYKVIRKSFNDDGVEISNIYYDNIIHLSVYHGAEQLYSRDFRKSLFTDFVPARFLSQAVLSDMDYESADVDGLHFNVTLCIPDVASCYLLDVNISLDGKMSLEVKEY